VTRSSSFRGESLFRPRHRRHATLGFPRPLESRRQQYTAARPPARLVESIARDGSDRSIDRSAQTVTGRREAIRVRDATPSLWRASSSSRPCGEQTAAQRPTPSRETPRSPEPAVVRTSPVAASTRRTRPFFESATYTVPSDATATSVG
jgi:hypothetical protein